jgi:hypothetical protein
VAVDEGRGKVGESDRDSDPKGAGYGRFNRNSPYITFSAAVDLRSALPDRAAPLAGAFLLANGVELHPLMGLLELMSAGRRRASALPWRCSHAVRRELQHPRPIDDPSVPFSPRNISRTPP